MSVQITAPSVAERWLLSGPAGLELDTFVVLLLNAGVSVEFVAAGTYRLDGPPDLVYAFKAEVGKVGLSITQEQPPAGLVSLTATVTPPGNFARSTIVHTTVHAVVARAVDHRLKVAPVGIGRFAVTGLTSRQMAWLVEALGKSIDEVLTLFETSPADVQREDALAQSQVAVNVVLPTRKSETTVTERNAEGAIVKTETIEVTQ